MGTNELVKAFYADLWNRWDDGAVDTVLADDFTFRGSLGDETVGRYRDGIRAGSSDFHNEIRGMVVEGDRAAVRLLYSGTHDGPLAGMRATGRRFAYAGAAFFTAGGGGRLADAWVLGDLVDLRAQLGSAGRDATT